MPAIWTDLIEAGAVVSITGVPYLVYDKRKRLPHLVGSFHSYQRSEFNRDGMEFGRIQFQGTIKNASLEANSVEKVFLVVWRTKRKMNTRRFGYGAKILDERDDEVGPPLQLPARSSRTVNVVCDFPLTGTNDMQLYRAMMPVAGLATHFLPRYEYELAFEDVDGNLFDKDGIPRSRKSIDLRWTLDNAWERFKDGRPWALLHHGSLIAFEEIRFAWKRFLRMIGL